MLRVWFGLVAMVAVVCCGEVNAKHIKVVDGDSLEIGSRRIRLIGIDAPEYRQFCYDADGEQYACGRESFQYLLDLVKNADYQVKCESDKKDTYNRELSECFVGGRSLNKLMLQSGWAVVYLSDDKEFIKAENSAKKHKKGIWRGKFMRPSFYRKLNKRQK